MSDTSHDRATVLRWIAQYYKPETYAAIDFQMFIDYIGDNSKAECLLKDLWVEELIQPLSSETKPAGGITQGVAATLDGKIRPSNRFVLLEKGLNSVEVLFDSDHEEAADKLSTIDHDLKAPSGPSSDRQVELMKEEAHGTVAMPSLASRLEMEVETDCDHMGVIFILFVHQVVIPGLQIFQPDISVAAVNGPMRVEHPLKPATGMQSESVLCIVKSPRTLHLRIVPAATTQQKRAQSLSGEKVDQSRHLDRIGAGEGIVKLLFAVIDRALDGEDLTQM